MADMSVYTTIVGMAVGSIVILGVIGHILFVKNASQEKKITMAHVLLALIGFLLIGAPTVWNRIEISVEGINVVLEKIKEVREENAKITTDLKTLETQRKELLGQVDALKTAISRGQIISPDSAAVRQTISRIETLRMKMDAGSGEIARSLDTAAERLAELESRAETLKKTQ